MATMIFCIKLKLFPISSCQHEHRECRSRCPSQQIISLHLSLPGLSRQSSMLNFLRSRKELHVPAPGISYCELAWLHLEQLLLLKGLGEMEVVKGCHCSTCPKECLQLPALKTFPDSPWEVIMDVGKCSDPTYSADGLLCVPTNFSTVLVKNPCGGEVVQTLQNCEMKEKCYRVSQEIGVGRCLGSCSSGDLCLLSCRESQDREECLFWAQAAPRHCALTTMTCSGSRRTHHCHLGVQVSGIAGLEAAGGAPGDPARLYVGYVNEIRLFLV
ncbi:uncharacterized protein LOC111940208 [Cyanistes caeruleus]|uniref:uncharacterized protein LOC111940208 n=1 Tax=Cyanistes caeruleus TaxID=156563 RepID=UPI000CDA8A09|nr:uncharacterized protein LOC111940208 [Cyanistes caeruleus]